MQADIFDKRQCQLGEGPIWHPLRQQFFWFDIFSKKLLSRAAGKGGFSGDSLEWQFDEYASAAGWIDRDHMLIATETGLYRFHLDSGEKTLVIALETDKPGNRSNDGRADPQGGFWIGTMGKQAEPEAGAIYRFYRGELRLLYDRLTIPNSICFAPDGRCAYYTDNGPNMIIFRQSLNADGWPEGEPEVFVDLQDEQRTPDGSVVDRQGALWNAQWGSSRVARYLVDGQFDFAIEVAATHSSCPAFGGPDMNSMLITSARAYLDEPGDQDGVCFLVTDSSIRGVPEPAVVV